MNYVEKRVRYLAGRPMDEVRRKRKSCLILSILFTCFAMVCTGIWLLYSEPLSGAVLFGVLAVYEYLSYRICNLAYVEKKEDRGHDYGNEGIYRDVYPKLITYMSRQNGFFITFEYIACFSVLSVTVNVAGLCLNPLVGLAFSVFLVLPFVYLMDCLGEAAGKTNRESKYGVHDD